ncbi:MAG: hypothetical protein HIU81_02970 [Acidobacteria bacterium]|nr:hypothetical protein [Acidobacteriota bacterium]
MVRDPRNSPANVSLFALPGVVQRQKMLSLRLGKFWLLALPPPLRLGDRPSVLDEDLLVFNAQGKESFSEGGEVQIVR